METNLNFEKPYTVENTPSMAESLNSSIGSLFNSDEQVGDKLVKIILSLINTGVDLGIDLTLGSGVTEKNIGDLKNEILNKLVIVKEFAKDPLIQEKVSEASKELVTLGLETIEEVEKPLNDIVDRLLEMIAETANKTVRGTLETARGVAQSALAEVPVVGGLVDLFLTAGVAFNRVGDFVFNATDNVLESTERIGNMIGSVTDNAQRAYQTYDTTKKQITDRIQNVEDMAKGAQARINEPMQRMRNIGDAVEKQKERLTTAPFPIQSGGRNKKINDLVSRISKRLASVN